MRRNLSSVISVKPKSVSRTLSSHFYFVCPSNRYYTLFYCQKVVVKDYHSVWKSIKKSHFSTLRAKRAKHFQNAAIWILALKISIRFYKWDIFGDFQTLWHRGLMVKIRHLTRFLGFSKCFHFLKWRKRATNNEWFLHC